MICTQDEVNVIVARVKRSASEVGEAFRSGDERAEAVVSAYQMFHARPEHGAMVALEIALDRWERRSEALS